MSLKQELDSKGKQMNVPMKRCSRCKETFPATNDYFSIDNGSTDGLYCHCKTCRRQYYIANKEKIRSEQKEYYAKNAATIRKAVQDYRSNNPEKVKASKKKHYIENKEVILQKNKEYAIANYHKVKEYKKKYYSENVDKIIQKVLLWQIENPEKKRVKDKRWADNNRDKVRRSSQRYADANLEKISERARRQRLRHPERAALTQQRRRTPKRGLPNTFTISEYEQMMDYWDGKCAICGREAQEMLQIVSDHWIALNDKRVNNPGTVATNLIPLCHSKKIGLKGCNNSKRDRDPEAWLKSKFDESTVRQILEAVTKYFEWVKSKQLPE